MNADEVREDWEEEDDLEIKEEILSDDENLDDGTTINEPNEDENEMGQTKFSVDSYCYFVKEEKHNIQFEEETEGESSLTPSDEQQNFFNFVSVKGEPAENDTMLAEDTISPSELPTESSHNDVQNHEGVKKKKWRGRFKAYSLFYSNDETPNTTSESKVPKTSSTTESVDGMGMFSSSVHRLQYENDYVSSEISPKKPRTVKEKIFECAICGHKFCFKRNLENHMLSHIEEARFKCEVCHINFFKRNILSEHMKIHGFVKTRSYKCAKCGSAFAEKTTLYTHLKVHSRERPFICAICDRSFKMKSVLKGHMLVHLDSESTFRASFDCKLCSRTFTRKNQLQKHVRDHAYQQYKFALYPANNTRA